VDVFKEVTISEIYVDRMTKSVLEYDISRRWLQVSLG
jgi:hypothetical protein